MKQGATMSNQTVQPYDIGQVIYILSNKSQKIVPGMVVEEVVVRKLDGNQVTWKIAVGPRGKERIIEHTKLDGEIHVSLSDIEAVMRRRLETFLSSLLNEAQEQSNQWYGKKQDLNTKEKTAEAVAASNLMVDPESLIEASPLSTKNEKYTSQNYNDNIVESETIELENGQKVKVNIKL